MTMLLVHVKVLVPQPEQQVSCGTVSSVQIHVHMCPHTWHRVFNKGMSVQHFSQISQRPSWAPALDVAKYSQKFASRYSRLRAKFRMATSRFGAADTWLTATAKATRTVVNVACADVNSLFVGLQLRCPCFLRQSVNGRDTRANYPGQAKMQCIGQ